MNDNENKFPDYVTFGTTFEGYKWYKPLITFALVLILYFVFEIILILVFDVIYGEAVIEGVIRGGYETLNTSDASVFLSYLSLVMFLPAIYIASRIVGDRPFSSYSSSRGGWNWKMYFKCLIIPLAVYLVYSLIGMMTGIESGGGKVNLSTIALVLSVILIPLQCIAEEHAFRGLLMQSFGSWFKIPVLAIILQAIVFAISHSYNLLGMLSVGVSGLVYGLLAWKTNGLEASAAIHSINNLMGFFVTAFGISSISSTLSVFDFAVDFLITLISAGLLYYVGNRRGWFDEPSLKAN